MDFVWKSEQFHIDPSRPLYEQFVEQLRALIVRGVLAPGTRMPSVRELAANIRVNPTTVMKTYQELERARLIVTFRGQGTYVTTDNEAIRESKRTIVKEAMKHLREIAESLDLTVDQLLELAQEKEE